MQIIGVDESGRGPLFGRVYCAAVILPNQNSAFNMDIIKDSKKFSSFKKLCDVSKYIKENSLYWNIAYVSEKMIDKINIREATFQCMHQAIRGLISKLNSMDELKLHIDGNAFNPLTIYHNNSFIELPYECIVGGDNSDKAIGAASILAKVARDEYIIDMCNTYPELNEKYGLEKNKGYGTLQHRNGIKQYGRTQWHRESFRLKDE